MHRPDNRAQNEETSTTSTPFVRRIKGWWFGIVLWCYNQSTLLLVDTLQYVVSWFLFSFSETLCTCIELGMQRLATSNPTFSLFAQGLSVHGIMLCHYKYIRCEAQLLPCVIFMLSDKFKDYTLLRGWKIPSSQAHKNLLKHTGSTQKCNVSHGLSPGV